MRKTGTKAPKRRTPAKKEHAGGARLSFVADPDYKSYGEARAVFRLMAPAPSTDKAKQLCPVCVSEDKEDNYYCYSCFVTAHHGCLVWGSFPQLDNEEVAVCHACLAED